MTHHDDPHHDHNHHHGHDRSPDHHHGHSHHHHDSPDRIPDPSSGLTTLQKLEKLLAHWIDHNKSHRDTFLTWSERAGEAGQKAVAGDLEKAVGSADEITRVLAEALKKLKG